MDAQEFRAQPELVTEASKLLNSGIFATMLQVLEAEAPHNQDLTNAAIIVAPAASEALGEIKGWVKCLKTLRSLATFHVKPEEVNVPQNYSHADVTQEDTQNG